MTGHEIVEVAFAELGLIDALPTPVLVVGEDGKILRANPPAATLLGYARTELEGQSVEMLLPAAARAAHVGQRATYHADPSVRPAGRGRDLEARHRDGHTLPVQVFLAPVGVDEDTCVAVSLIDRTEHQALTAKMMEMDRMIAVGTLAAGVGHEINNPLAFVTANLDVALEQLATVSGAVAHPALAEIREALADARDGAWRIRGIVRDLKRFARGDDGETGIVDLHRTLSAAMAMAGNEIRHRAKLVKDLGAPPPVEGNDGQLAQVFLNLLVNAAQAIPIGAAERQTIRVTTRADGTDAVVEVSDTGTGIDPERLDRIFDPFFTTKPVGEGTGLGLAICRRIVQAHHGRVEVLSRPGEGTTFRIVLPGAPGKAAAAPTRKAKAKVSTRRGRILVIDDEEAVGRAVSRVLGRDHEVTVVSEGRRGVAEILGDPPFDLVLCDLMMPELTGMEIHRRVAETDPARVGGMVFITGGAFTAEAQRFLDEVDNETLAKPFDVTALRAFVARRLQADAEPDGPPEDQNISR